MENYKASYYNQETFEKNEVETQIPSDLVSQLSKVFGNIEDYMISPPFINTKDFSVQFGVIDGSNTMKYKISIKSIKS